MSMLSAVSLSLAIGTIAGLLTSTISITTRKSFWLLTQFAGMTGAIAGLVVWFTLDPAIATDSATRNLLQVICLVSASALSSAGTVYVIGKNWGKRIIRQKLHATEVASFLRRNFTQLATPSARKGDKSAITRESLERARAQFKGDELTLVEESILHFRDIGHLVSTDLVSIPSHGETGSSFGYYNLYPVEIYAITLADLTTYRQRLDHKYLGWWADSID